MSDIGDTNDRKWECEREFTVKLKVTHRLYNKEFIEKLLQGAFELLFIEVEEVTQNK